MDELLIKLAKGEKVTDELLEAGLYQVCEDVHASCNNGCPVYKLNGNKVPDTAKDFKINRGCDCFKNGREMLKFIRNHQTQ